MSEHTTQLSLPRYVVAAWLCMHKLCVCRFWKDSFVSTTYLQFFFGSSKGVCVLVTAMKKITLKSNYISNINLNICSLVKIKSDTFLSIFRNEMKEENCQKAAVWFLFSVVMICILELSLIVN